MALVLLPSSLATAQECFVRGDDVKLENVIVHPPGDDVFDVTIEGMSIAAKLPTRRGKRAQLTVDGVISFAGTAIDVWYTVNRPLDLAQGMVHLQRGAQVVHAHAKGNTVVAMVATWADDVLEGEDAEPDELVGEVAIPCAALSLGEASDDAQADDQPNDPLGDDTFWAPRQPRSRITLRAGPDSHAPSVVFEYPNCENCIALERIEERNGWMRVGRRGWRAIVTGWVPKSMLQRDEAADGGRSGGCHGDHGQGGYGHGWVRRPEGLYEGPARVKTGTVVYSDEAERGGWATVKQEATFGVSYVRGEDWAQLEDIPGLAPGFHPAHVRATSVIFPEQPASQAARP